MDYQKQKIVAIAGGAVFVVAAGVLGYFLFSAVGARAEAEETLEAGMSEFRRVNSAPTFPSKKSIAGVKTNAAELVAWRQAAFDRVKVGDKTFPDETPPIFKQRLQREVRRLGKLEGGVDGKIAKAGFLFGFDKYLGENGVLPSVAELPALAAQLDAAVKFVDILVKAGADEITRCEAIVAEAKEDEDDSRKSKKRKAQKKSAEDEGPKPVSRDYALAFSARPAAFAAVLNELAADPRFMVAKDLSFKASRDLILEKFAADDEAKQRAAEAKANEANGGGRRRRRRAAVVEDAFASGSDAPKSANRMVSDPELDAPLAVELKVTVWDFGSASAPAVASAPAAETKGDK